MMSAMGDIQYPIGVLPESYVEDSMDHARRTCAWDQQELIRFIHSLLRIYTQAIDKVGACLFLSVMSNMANDKYMPVYAPYKTIEYMLAYV